ncbi:hypothetical protein GQ55_3G179500 [Panicum hallii var. hallii]|uniref:Ribosomal protein S11 n=1 Tax=Panicum hallii var. hallii TaxID=1504633 RepID=A0A2T7EAP2_9POAL|nr:hypothetical protein GQ55_3G179500 [Panicum hallii var. hallii]
MSMFLSARLGFLRRSLAAPPRAASLGAGLRQASDESPSPSVLHCQLLPRFFTSNGFGSNMPFPPSGSVATDLRSHQNFNRTNFVRHDFRAKTQVNFNSTDNGATMTAGGERPFNLGELLPFSASRVIKEHEQYSQRKKTFVTVTEASGNKKTGASAGCLEDRKGWSRLSRYAAEATAECVGRSVRKMGLRSVVMKVKGASFFKKKKKVILSWREGFRWERVRDQSPITYIHDVTQLPHNGCRLPKQRRV